MMNPNVTTMILSIGLCATPVFAQNSATMMEEAKYKAAAKVEQTKKAETHETAPAYQNVQMHQTVEEKKAKSEPKCGNCPGAVTPE